ncbi:hypothetical protein A2U01_0060936 [Trifolium medium]|uniref:Uncharacterized protein n=1 Tax=Trifolium medium TaxID=97028 RepID=A0A392RUH8_9FABA|nr:hypothetical protein [Trifolium medium]
MRHTCIQGSSLKSNFLIMAELDKEEDDEEDQEEGEEMEEDEEDEEDDDDYENEDEEDIPCIIGAINVVVKSHVIVQLFVLAAT